MINIKNLEEIKLLRKSGKILSEVKQKIWNSLREGVSTAEIDEIAYNEIIKRGAKPAFKGYNGFPATICISINQEMIHGIPSSRIIKNGDIVKVDLGVVWNNYYSDSAFTKGIGNISIQDKKLINIAKNAFFEGVKVIKPGVRLGDVEYAIGNYISSQNMFTPKEFSGHGIGKLLHEEPFVKNNGVKGTGPILRNGMALAIEPMILQKSEKIKILSDKWTVVSDDGFNTAHYEHTILIWNNEVEILTEGI